MPSKSPEQARLMRAVAHGWKKPGGGGPTKAVAREFTNADRRSKVQGYSHGGGVGPGPGTFGRVAGPLSRDPRMMGVAGPQRLQAGPQRQQPPRGGYGGGRQPQRGGYRGRPRIDQGGGRFPQRGGLGQAGRMMQQPGGGKPPTRRIAPPPGKFPGGGNPMTGGRNPMMRQAANRNRPMMGGRTGPLTGGPTSYLR